MPSSNAVIQLQEPAAVMRTLCAHLAEHDIAVTVESDRADAELGDAGATLSSTGGELAVEVNAANENRLEELVAFFASHVREFAHPQEPKIQWQGIPETRLVADFRLVTVTAILDLTAHMRRFTFTAADLGRFATDNDLHVRLFFPQPGAEPLWPMRGPDGLPLPADPACKPFVRKYTIRRIDPAASRFEVDFVLHEAAGPGSDWAKEAAVGSVIGMAGPGGRTAKAAEWMMLCGDETALPAIARILEGLPSSTEGHAIFLAEDAADHVAFSAPAGIAITWIDRTDGGRGFEDAIRKIAIPEGRSRFCWLGAEFSTVQAIRQHWRDQGLTKEEQLAVAYWRLGTD